MEARRTICTLQRGGMFFPPLFVLTKRSGVDRERIALLAEDERVQASEADDAKLVNKLNNIMRKRASGVCTIPALCLCVPCLCSDMRAQTALRQVALCLQAQEGRTLQLCFRQEGQSGPQCWVEQIAAPTRITLYQNN